MYFDYLANNKQIKYIASCWISLSKVNLLTNGVSMAYDLPIILKWCYLMLHIVAYYLLNAFKNPLPKFIFSHYCRSREKVPETLNIIDILFASYPW
jgi:hypothetical protein